MKRKKSKLGVALENAIFFMLITFTLCALLATVVLVGNNYNSLSQNAFLDRVALSQAIETEEDFGGYTVAVAKNEEEGTRTLEILKDRTPVLYIKKDGSAIIYRGTKPPQ